MLTCVLAIREGFLKAPWKEADTSAAGWPGGCGHAPSELSSRLCNVEQPHSRRRALQGPGV